jgi:hypothetical protein
MKDAYILLSGVLAGRASITDFPTESDDIGNEEE